MEQKKQGWQIFWDLTWDGIINRYYEERQPSKNPLEVELHKNPKSGSRTSTIFKRQYMVLWHELVPWSGTKGWNCSLPVFFVCLLVCCRHYVAIRGKCKQEKPEEWRPLNEKCSGGVYEYHRRPKLSAVNTDHFPLRCLAIW